MEKKFKSEQDVFKQKIRIMETYGTPNTEPSNPWLRIANKISDHYLNMIARHVDMFKPGEEFTFCTQYMKGTESCRIKFAHVVRSYMPDTSREEIAKISPFTVEGLYVVLDNGERMTPYSLYFGCDARFWRDDPEHAQPNGYCYFHYLNALRPVMLPNGKRFIRREWANVSCRYANGLLYDFHRE